MENTLCVSEKLHFGEGTRLTVLGKDYIKGIRNMNGVHFKGQYEL